MIQSAEAAMNSTSNILTRLRELAMQAASDGIGNSERGYVQKEVAQLTSEIDRNANAAEYNGTKLLNAATTLDFQVGIRNVAANDQISVATIDIRASTLGVSSLDFNTKAAAQAALSTIDTALAAVSDKRATFGAVGNRFETAISNIHTFSETLASANSRIRDVDVAEETSRLSRSQILTQAGISVLSQANQLPQMALKLLG
jgi:flagellin